MATRPGATDHSVSARWAMSSMRSGAGLTATRMRMRDVRAARAAAVVQLSANGAPGAKESLTRPFGTRTSVAPARSAARTTRSR